MTQEIYETLKEKLFGQWADFRKSCFCAWWNEIRPFRCDNGKMISYHGVIYLLGGRFLRKKDCVDVGKNSS